MLFYICTIKVKVKYTLEQAAKARGEKKGIALFFP
jgi:hypothetical protein